jgi:hypothetical protein
MFSRKQTARAAGPRCLSSAPYLRLLDFFAAVFFPAVFRAATFFAGAFFAAAF